MSAERVFFAVWPAAALAGKLAACAGDMQGRAMGADSLHITLAFLGEQRAERILVLQEIAASLRLPACTLQLDQLGYWPHKHIVWAGPSQAPAALREFVEALHASLRDAGFSLDERAWQPHVTLLRNAAAIEPCTIDPLDWPVNAWCLVKSQPALGLGRYTALASWPAASD